MTDVLFVQGAGASVHDDWDARLVDSLRRELGAGYDVRYPRMPNESDPSLATWRPVLEQELASLGPGAIAIGHSLGGTILIHALADSPPMPTPGVVALIAAPYIGDGGWQSDDIAPRTAFDQRLPANVPVFLYHGERDTIVPVAHVDRYADALPRARVHRLSGRDHQMNGDLSDVARDIRALRSSSSER